MSGVVGVGVTLILIASAHLFFKRTKPSAKHILVGVAFTVYCCGIAVLVFSSNGGGEPGAAVRLVPFKTIGTMLKDCMRNGIFNRSELANWNGMPITFLTKVLSHSTRNLGANTLLFIPIGALLVMQWPRIRLWVAALFSLAVPIYIELGQLLFVPGRTCDVDDVILNFAGIFFGCLVIKFIDYKRRTNGKRNINRNQQVLDEEVGGT